MCFQKLLRWFRAAGVDLVHIQTGLIHLQNFFDERRVRLLFKRRFEHDFYIRAGELRSFGQRPPALLPVWHRASLDPIGTCVLEEIIAGVDGVINSAEDGGAELDASFFGACFV